MEKAREYHCPLYICFVDLRKAYDSINRAALWSVLQYCYHLPSKLLKIIEALHSNTSAAVRKYGKISDHFPVSSGVKQGCVLAPTLFNLYFDSVIGLVITDHQPDVGVCLLYLLDADLVGNRKKLTSEVSVSDLEYADEWHRYLILMKVYLPCWNLWIRLAITWDLPSTIRRPSF